MSEGYYDIYKLRLNRYGNTYQERMQGMRERQFDAYLARAVNKITFEYDNKSQVGCLERYQQNDTKAIQYLLTYVSLVIPGGTILQLPNTSGTLESWMIYYQEEIKATGYNRYVVLRMTHYLTWTDRNKTVRNSYAYMYGQENNMLKDELQSRSRMDAVYKENLKSSFFIMPRNEYIRKDIYIEVGTDPYKEGYRVTGYDLQSTEGVEYVTVDPVYIYDLTAPPTQTQQDQDTDFYWFNGGTNGS